MTLGDNREGADDKHPLARTYYIERIYIRHGILTLSHLSLKDHFIYQ